MQRGRKRAGTQHDLLCNRQGSAGTIHQDVQGTGHECVILDHNIDTSFITQLEQRNEHYQFKRIDADVTDALKSDDTADLTEETNTLSDLFKKTLNNDKLTVKVESLKDADVASILTLSEQGRRMQDMMKMYAAGGMGGMDRICLQQTRL